MRVEKLKKALVEKKVSSVLVTNILNVRYLTGFTGTTGIALITPKNNYFITDFRYETQGAREVEINGFKLIREDKSFFERAKNLCEVEGIKDLAYEDLSIKLADYRKLEKEFDNFQLVDLGETFLDLRMIKDEKELGYIKEAARIADEAFAAIEPLIKAGVTEKELSTRLEYEMKLRGAEGPSFDTIVASNERSALPHGVASEKKLVNEGFVKFDFGAFYKGYASDMTRVIYLGNNPTEKHLEIYEIVKRAQELAVSAIKPGITTKELDAVAREYITNKGYGENFGHGLGHGVGLQIHEKPGVSSKAKEITLEEGMVITIEPGIYLDGFGGVRIEDDVIVTATGHEVLNKTTKEFRKFN